MNWKPDIFLYTDYRMFLRDYYEAAKSHVKGFSYRYLSQKAGFQSTNFFKLVIDGKRNLSAESTQQVANALGLSQEESSFFVLLVNFAQANEPGVQAELMEEIVTTRRFLEAKPLDGLLFEYLSHWYNLAIRELAGREDFKAEPGWIASQLRPSISPDKAQQALELLLELGLLVQTDQRIDRGEPSLDAGHEVRAVGVRQFHRQMLTCASASIDDVPSEERDISAITVCVRQDTIPELKRRLREFRERFMAYCDEQKQPEVVYQLNIQLFPMSYGKESS